MNPATDDSLTWLVDLGLVLVEEGRGGSAHLRGQDGSSIASSVDAALGDLLGVAADDAEVSAFLAEARSLGRASSTLSGRRAVGMMRRGSLVVVVGGAPDLLSSAVAHELANALTGIAGWARLARAGKTPLPPRTAEALQTLESTASDALDTARSMLAILRGSRTHGTARVGKVLTAVVDALTPLAMERGVTLRTDLRAEEVALGSVELRSVVSNLVKNAIEAAPRGEVVISATSVDGGVRIDVVDDGAGMDADTIARAFDTGFTTKSGGSGVGLPLVRTLVQAGGGDLVVESAAGKGTRVTVTLRSPAEVRGGASAKSGVRARKTRRTRVLFVDDDAALREMVKTALELRDVSVDVASGFREACALESSWDIVIADLGLRDGRGDALLEELSSQGRTRRVVLTSGGATSPGPEIEVLVKPFSLDELHELVERLSPARRERVRTKRMKQAR